MLNAKCVLVNKLCKKFCLESFTGIIFIHRTFMNKENYLRRIRIEATDQAADLKHLKFLQRRHLLNVPFENLDIHWKRPIVLDDKSFYEKLIVEKRGGFCYELNGLFYELLREIGFQSKMVSARVSDGKGGFGAEFDHLAIITQIGGKEYLVDVGFGKFTAEPLQFILDIEQTDANGVFSIRKFDEIYFEVVRKESDTWVSEYVFTTLKRDLKEFSEMCRFHQTSPESHFTRNKVCSLMTVKGRKTLTNSKFVETDSAQKTEIKINSEKQFNRILEREFNIKKL